MPSAEAFWEGLCQKRGLLWGLFLYPLSILYGAVSRLLRVAKPARLKGLKVISVGNLSMGGAGKSPLVIEIARYLKAKRVAVLTRGYGKDEAQMLVSALPQARVIVDSRRLRAAQSALSQGCRVAVLDDGFQRRHELERNLDILVLDWQRRELEAHCLPAGRLREPLVCAAEADAVVVTHAPEGWNPEALRAGLPESFRGLRVFRGDHEPVGLRSLGGKKLPLRWLKNRPVIAMSGIGRPDAFEESLATLGAKVKALRFGDHHNYSASDVPAGASIVCTAKDAVKLRTIGGKNIQILEMRLRVTPQKDFEAMISR